MKKITLLVAFTIAFIAASAQDTCTVSVLGKTGSTFFKKVEVKRISKLDLNKDCKYKILSFSIEFTDAKKSFYEFDIPGNELPDNVYKKMLLADKKITFKNILIGTGLKKDEPIKLAPINFTLVK